MAIKPLNSIGGFAVGEGQTPVIDSSFNVTANTVSTTGNITGQFILGNGSLLTGMYTNSDAANLIASGSLTSAIFMGNVVAENFIGVGEFLGNITAANVIGTVGSANTVTDAAQPSITSLGLLDSVSANGNIVTDAYFYGNGAFLTGLPAGYTNSNVASYLPTYSGNVGDGNGYVLGNGAFLTGLPAGYSNADVAAYLPTYSGNLGANVVTGNIFVGDGGYLSNIQNANVIGAYSNADVASYLPTYSGLLGGTLTTSYQPNITQVGTLGSLAVANSVSINGALDVVGNTVLSNLYVTGNVNVPGNIVVIQGNAAQFYGTSPEGFGAIWAGLAFGYANLDFTVAEFSANNDDYAQINFQNINAGANATTDYIATADNGTNSTFYLDLGIASSTFDGQSANNIGNVIKANDSYLYAMGAGNAAVAGGNLVIAAPGESREIIFAAGGGTTDDVVMTVSAGNVLVNGNIDATNIVDTRVVPRVNSVADTATITPTGDDSDQFNITALAQAATFAAPSGTPTDGQKLTLRIRDNGTARALTWNAIYRVIGTVLPTTTVAGKVIYVGCIYNSQDTFWDVVSVAQQA